MAEASSKHLFLCLLFLLTFSSSEVFSRKGIEQRDLKTEANQVFDNIPHRELLDHFHYKTTQHDDTVYPPPTLPFPPDNNLTPTIVTVPSTIPVTITPDPASTPVTVPSTTPVPITNPVTTPGTFPGTQPVTNPVTTFPAPTSGVPVTTPVTNPVGPPSASGQSWCVAKSGASESTLQSALDYACGIGGADCSVIQQGGGCYDPNTLENHASYAFNSYYQKNPVQTSCDFGGTAMVTTMNPSSGTCIYPSSSSSSSLPMTGTTPSPTTTSSSGTTIPGSVYPPSVLNSSNPDLGSASVFGGGPPSYNSSTSRTRSIQPVISCIVLVTSMVTGRFIQDM